MTDLANIQSKLCEQFPFLSDKDFRSEGNKLWLSAQLPPAFIGLLRYCYTELGFNDFHMTVGLDCGDHFEVIYIFTDSEHTMLNLRQRTVSREDTAILSVFDFFENSLFHERELVDLFGIDVQGLPAGHRYPLPDKWPEGNYPLRKDWKTEFFDKQTLTYDLAAAEEAERLAIEEAKRKQAAKEAAIAAALAKKAQKEKEANNE